jgi:alkanesulfonate monooxygenase SsuD/methylene tetrahydromethanopterin reductase-like flavin-dependent oxidoreductase (luciferase family)
MDGLWADYERAAVESKLGAAIVGSPETVRAGIEKLALDTGAKEIIAVTDTYSFDDRLRSYELLAEAVRPVSTV